MIWTRYLLFQEIANSLVPSLRALNERHLDIGTEEKAQLEELKRTKLEEAERHAAELEQQVDTLKRRFSEAQVKLLNK